MGTATTPIPRETLIRLGALSDRFHQLDGEVQDLVEELTTLVEGSLEPGTAAAFWRDVDERFWREFDGGAR